MACHRPTPTFAPAHSSHSTTLERALERFDWLIEEVRDEVHRGDVLEIQGVLNDPKARTSAKERALVMLGLLGTAEAGAALGWFDPKGEHPRVRLLHRLAKRECARRRSAQARPGITGRARRAA